MKSKESVLPNFLKNAIWIIFGIIVGYLLISSIFSTCYIGRLEYLVDSGATEINSEHTFYIRDSYPVHFIVFLLCSVFLFLRGKKENKVIPYRYIGMAMLLISAILCLYIVYAGQYYPKYDQASVIEAAAAFNMGDYSLLERGGYMFKYPHQFGVTCFYMILSKIFGNLNIIAFQVVNGICILLSYYLLAKIAKLLTHSKEWSDAATLIVCAVFLPYLFYVTFLYGTVVGFCLAILSFYHMLLFKEKCKWIYMFSSSLCMMLAVILKSNYMVFMIAMIIYLLGNAIVDSKMDRKTAYKSLIFGIVILVFFFAGKWGINRYLTSLNSGEQIRGIPMITYVTMGLQDGKTAAGWYNGYNNTVYEQNMYDYAKTADAAKADLVKIIKKYPEDISASISFFVKKVTSQWNNPTFQSLWILEERSGKNGLGWIMRGNARNIYIIFVNLLQTWILTGTALYVLLRIKKSTWQEILLLLTFIGGFLFHTFWEAQSVYAMPYFLLLLPICIWGYAEWGQFLVQRRFNRKHILAAAIIVVLICAASYTDGFCKLFARNDDTGVFNTYTQETVLQE